MFKYSFKQWWNDEDGGEVNIWDVLCVAGLIAIGFALGVLLT